MSYTELVLIGSHVPVLLATGYACMVYRSLSNELRAFSHFLLLSAIVQLSALVLALMGRNNLILLHVFVPLGFAALALFYQQVLRGFIDKRVIPFMIVTFFICSILNSIFLQKPFTFNSNALTVESVLLIILSLSTSMFLLNDIIRHNRQRMVSLSWINSGIFVYYTCSLLLFYFGGKILAVSFPRQFSRYTWLLHSLFSMIMYSCFFIGLWKRPKR